MDVTILSRIQFALTIGFHYLFPPLSIGLGLILVIMEGMYLKTKKPAYKAMTQFWVKIFALTFALGVATGLVQVFAFGNNWARFSKYVGDVFGSALAAEGIFAFFLESGFLGLMLFGWERVSKKMHYFSTICVALGAHFSAVWIIVANSWMQTPAGYAIVGDGEKAHAHVTNFWQMVFNYSTVDRLTHTIIACWITGAFLVLSVSAYYFLKKRHLAFARVSMKIGLIVASVSLVLQLISADYTARGVAKNQPEKLAAIEGIYKTEEKTPMTLIGYVDEKTEQVKGIKVPALLSLLVHRNAKEPVIGLDQFAKEDRPNTPVVFQLYHLMIYLWGAMAILVLAGIILWNKKRLEKGKWVLRGLVISVFFPHLANQAGWFTAEMGRQPWIVYRLLRTSHGVSRSIHPEYVIGSIIMFVVIYSLLFCLFLFLLNQKIKHGPDESFKIEEDEAPLYRDVYQGEV
ncbi:MAG: cytochrome ubiquinol oxidase subunit I [Simkaniaceae bacterium]|nr:cytochrome ubiquinol oxidase subunit I [Simkaniaceae bacterium]